jgi:hypothetical protein
MRADLLKWMAADDLIKQGVVRVPGETVESFAARWKPSRSFRLQRGKIQRGSRPRYREDHYEQVADAYREAYQAGLPPARSVAETWGVPAATARSWVRRCRDRGLLPPTDERKPSA